MYVAHRRAGVYEEATNDCFFYASAFIFLGKEGKTKPMDETQILLERHDQRLNVLERDVKALQDIRSELKTMGLDEFDAESPARDPKMYSILREVVNGDRNRKYNQIFFVFENQSVNVRAMLFMAHKIKQIIAFSVSVMRKCDSPATEMKHTNRQLARSEEKIDAIENRPWARMQQLITAIASALAGVLLSAAVGRFWV